MKVCPRCQKEYDDNLEVCPDDGAVLVKLGEPNNPRLPEVIPVDESAETRMFDVSEVNNAISEAVNEESRSDGATTIPDVGPTEALTREQLEEAMRQAEAARQAQAEATGKIDRTDVISADDRRPPSSPSGSSSRAGTIAAVTTAVVLLLVLAVALAVVFWPKPTILKITSTPKNANVEIDGMLSGQTPLDMEVEPGPHSVGLSLDDHHPFVQVVEVPKKGRILAVALVEVQPEEPDDANDDDATLHARAEAIFKEVDALLDTNDLDAAESRLEVLAALVPGDERIADRQSHLQEARASAGGSKVRSDRKDVKDPRVKPSHGAGDESIPKSRKQREKEADRLYRQGEELYKKGQFTTAKELLQKAIRFDTRFYPPHRVLARIYNREKNVQKTKYHLTRYIELGGSDKDYKIRQWLATH